MYKIGEFSKMTDLPVRTLRYYDEIGILKPEFTDDFSGYRYYTDVNVNEAEMIKLLKSLEFSLDEILMHKDSLSKDVILKKKEELEMQIYLLELKCQRLVLLGDQLENNNGIIYKNSDVMVLRLRNEERIRENS